MLKIIMLATAATLLAACATDPETAELRAKIRNSNLSAGTVEIAKEEGKVDLIEDQRVVCERYTPTGSHRSQVRCTTVAEQRRQEEANAREMRKLQRPPPDATGTRSR